MSAMGITVAQDIKPYAQSQFLTLNFPVFSSDFKRQALLRHIRRLVQIGRVRDSLYPCTRPVRLIEIAGRAGRFIGLERETFDYGI
jgi:hypothetical protein